MDVVEGNSSYNGSVKESLLVDALARAPAARLEGINFNNGRAEFQFGAAVPRAPHRVCRVSPLAASD